MLSFYRRNAWWLGTGMVFTFGSSFGQTFFISLFAGAIRDAYGLTNGQWGGLYTIATLASALCLSQLGRLADTMPLMRLAILVLLAYALAALTMALSAHVAMVGLAIFGLRLCGQGMMGHIAITAMARWFRANRARAVSVAVLGMPLGEAIFPFVGVALFAFVGWRASWAIVALVVLAVFLPAVVLLMRHGRTPQGEGGEETTFGMDGRHWTRAEVMRHWSFWILMPGILAPPFIGTCAFFHQVHIAEVRGFDLATMTLGYPLYAALVVGAALLAGQVVDRLGPTRMLPIFLLPMGGAIALLALPGGVAVWFAMLAGLGISQGVTVTLMGAMWPTLYGTRWIGSVKALGSSLMVMATALGPGITGALIDRGFTFPEQALALSAYCLVMTLALGVVSARLTRRVYAPRPPVLA